MFLKNISVIILSIMLLGSLTSSAQSPADRIPIVPAPVKIDAGSGKFKIDSTKIIYYNNEKLLGDIRVFNAHLSKFNGFHLKPLFSKTPVPNHINLVYSAEMDSEAYQLNIDSSGIKIAGGKDGLFYGLQTLTQLIYLSDHNKIQIPFVSITDYPRFSYRGMHLDVVRHFFPPSSIKKYLDYLSLYKMNVFHWHLTDDQSWRIEIKKYPELIKVGSWRNGTLVGHLGDKPETYDTIRYGGYYTQKEITEIIEYATARHITIIPEIEMPGHAQAALAAYPELSCTGGPFEVGKTWGVYKDVFCPKEETFVFLQNVLDEVCALFPGKYIHIGGDECPKDRWKECPHCQELIRKNNLPDENALQRYFTNRIATYLKTKNKIAIGWDEILEEGLDSSAVIMSWRGYTGGANAAIKGHDVVMSPYTHCYFDMYQSRNTEGRIAIGGFLPVEQVYSFEPVPDVLNADQAKHISGAQGNVWTEYITTEARLQDKIFPRLPALSEVVWSPKESKDYAGFCSRIISQFRLFNLLGVKYSTALYDIYSKVTPNGNNGIFVELNSNYPRGKIYYTVNGKVPEITGTVYSGKIGITQPSEIRAVMFESDMRRGSMFFQSYNINKATGKEIILANPPHVEYSKGGAFSLVNGVIGTLPWIPSEWLGFLGTDLDATIDLGSVQTISEIEVDVLKDEEGRIYLPKEINVFVSDRNTDFTLAGILGESAIQKMDRNLIVKFPETNARYIKVVVKNSNGKDWLFVDEIRVE